MSNTSANYIKSIQNRFHYYKNLGDKTLEELTIDEMNWKYNEESNSIATIANHIVGNMLSRWTNFYSEDGEKQWRERDLEFEDQFKSKMDLVEHWERGWNCLLQIIDNLTKNELNKTVQIRAEDHTVIDAINRQFAHYSYHIGQMIFAGKMIKNEKWKSLSIPKNKSEDFNKLKFKN